MDSPATILKRHGLRPKKSWGQCFLHDRGVVARIVEAARLAPTETVVEIGAGLGTLTAQLAGRAGRVIAIEKDRDLARVLRDELGHLPNLEIVEQNALTFELARVSGPFAVVGNLPYNISAPLLFHLLDGWRAISRVVAMLQREVAERVVAGPGGGSYGVPSVLCQQVARAEKCFQVPRGAFTPSPRVDSAVVRLTMRDEPLTSCDAELFRTVVRAAFATRRKMLKNALESCFEPAVVERALERARIDGRRRGETLTVEEFGALTQGFAAGAGP